MGSSELFIVVRIKICYLVSDIVFWCVAPEQWGSTQLHMKYSNGCGCGCSDHDDDAEKRRFQWREGHRKGLLITLSYA